MPSAASRALTRRADRALCTLAFPPTRAAHAEASAVRLALPAELRRLGSRRHELDDQGYPFTDTRHGFDLGTAEWLCETHPRDVEVDWGHPTAAVAVQTLLAPLLLRGEEEGYDSDALSMHAWIQRARGDAWPSDLAWLLEALLDSGDSLARRAAEWEQAGIPLRWHLRDAGVTAAVLDAASPVLRRTFRGSVRAPGRFVRDHAPPRRRLTGRQAERVIAVARETLAARAREVHAISYANADEVWWLDLGRGTAMAVIGVRPALRLSLEANYGFVLFANGIPVGYGGVSPVFRQANTGINVFPAFRGTEAAALWLGALAGFRTLFGTRRFIANPFQVGRGNPEAIASGAFWFYYRCGFRPADATLAELAEAENQARHRPGARRTPASALKRLAAADLVLTLPDATPEDAFDERSLVTLALRHTARVAAEGHVGRHQATAQIASRVARRLGVRRSGWSAAEREAFEALAPLVDAIPDLGDWSARERTALGECLRAKGGPQERDYVLRAARHPRWRAALTALAR